MMRQQDLNNIVKSIAERDKEITRLRAEVEAWKQRKSCDTCARERGSAKCGSCCLYYSKKACLWIPAKAAIRGEWVKVVEMIEDE